MDLWDERRSLVPGDLIFIDSFQTPRRSLLISSASGETTFLRLFFRPGRPTQVCVQTVNLHVPPWRLVCAAEAESVP
jgi:hypothetical protein